MSLPVFHVARVKLKLVIVSQHSLLHVREIQQLVVDEYELHAALEGRNLTVHGRTAWRHRNDTRDSSSSATEGSERQSGRRTHSHLQS